VSAYEAVLFDMGGVTVETAAAWRRLERTEILPSATESAAPTDAIRALSVADAYARLTAMEGVDLTVDAQGFEALYTEHAAEVYRERACLMDGYRELLGRPRAGGVALGLVSASRRTWVEMVLDRFDLGGVSASDIDGPAKPEPGIYRVAARRLDLPPGRCLAVEDSTHGIAAATGVGVACLALRGEGRGQRPLGGRHRRRLAGRTAGRTAHVHRRLSRSVPDIGEHGSVVRGWLGRLRRRDTGHGPLDGESVGHQQVVDVRRGVGRSEPGVALGWSLAAVRHGSGVPERAGVLPVGGCPVVCR
jgi:HAD superfamily hydrolase (TIGR01509 family)